MSEENKPIEIEPDINTDAEQQPDVCLSLKGLDTEVTLPNLNSADLPIELVNVVLIVNPLGWISAIVKGWAEGSGLDPKSFTSSSSTNSITRR